jgi:hypothetical protein
MAKSLTNQPAKPHGQIDNTFQPDELLFRRIHPEHYIDGELQVAAIELPDMSVNRGKYSRPEDAIRAFQNWGIGEFKVKHVPPGISSFLGAADYEIRIAHVPEPDNYSHSEIQAFENGTHVTELSANNVVEQRFHLQWRLRLLAKVRVRKEPEARPDFWG